LARIKKVDALVTHSNDANKTFAKINLNFCILIETYHKLQRQLIAFNFLKIKIIKSDNLGQSRLHTDR